MGPGIGMIRSRSSRQSARRERAGAAQLEARSLGLGSERLSVGDGLRDCDRARLGEMGARQVGAAVQALALALEAKAARRGQARVAPLAAGPAARSATLGPAAAVRAGSAAAARAGAAAV